MAQTGEGKKKVYVHPYTKEDGTKVKIHYRSTPNTSKGKKQCRTFIIIRMCLKEFLLEAFYLLSLLN